LVVFQRPDGYPSQRDAEHWEPRRAPEPLPTNTARVLEYAAEGALAAKSKRLSVSQTASMNPLTGPKYVHE